ncbi:MAG: OmpH family outer membrane protein [Bacteroidaceae bacterium]|nr:OmpH family outer membrane protein [Bacteroidaceae bacterium]
MKKYFLSAILLFTLCTTINAQKFALIDMDYILKNIPAYNDANDQLQKATQKYQDQIEAISNEAKNMYKDYQTNSIRLSSAEKTQKENAIVEKEKSAAELKRNYFGQEGELTKMRTNLMKPIQDKIYDAVKAISERSGYDVVCDRASASSIIFASPNIDISNQILDKLGYSK